MPTKTDRILSYLPGTFRALPKPTALYAVVDAFGGELLGAENSLAALMAAHWVDHADRGAELIDDLGGIAKLYGLAPRPEESVEEFREHLKRYIRIFLEGPSTVQGILRITAEALGLRIDDKYADMDSWWMRRGPEPLVTVEARGEDAAKLLFGIPAKTATGEPARPARIVRTIDLGGGADLRGAPILRIAVDGAPPVDIDLAAHAATIDGITQAVNEKLGLPVASHEDGFLTLASPETGPGSSLEIGEPASDAAPQLLGLLPRIHRGAGATAAEVTGIAIDGPVDLTENRYLRLLVDGKHLAEIDCGGANPATTTLDEIRDAINDALGLAVASHDGHHLKLTSSTVGFGSSIAFQPAAALDARERLFGGIGTFHVGRDDRAALATGVNDLSRGVDLSARSKVRIRLDNQPATTVDCAGADSARTLLSEIVAALNTALGQGIASHDGRFVRIDSPTRGSASVVAFEALPSDEDATGVLFGIGPRSFRGTHAVAARVAGTPDLTKHTDQAGLQSDGVDLGALHILGLRLDAGALVEVDVASRANDPRRATLAEIGRAINDAVGTNIASDDGQHLILTSPTTGAASRIAIEPLEIKCRRRFVTRAFVSNEAVQAAFGFSSREAQGAAATKACVAGELDLSRGVDLREARLLRLTVDARPAVEIDCAGQRPRATLIGEVIEKINSEPGISGVAASPDGKKLVLTSPSSGANSLIAFESPHAALDILFRAGPGSFRGRDATRVTFVGTVDLSGGIDLSTASKIKISIDGEEHEIDCAKPNDPAHTALNDVIVAINLAFGGKQVVLSDGTHVVLSSQIQGEDSRVEFVAPSDADATKQIFGIAAPRSYHGAAALPAQILGKDLSAGADVSAKRFFELAVNGGPQVDVEWTSGAAPGGHRTLGQIVEAINASLTAAQIPAIAKETDGRLALATAATGATARLDLLPYTAGDARPSLLGKIAEITTGKDPAPAVIEGEADLLTPIDLSERRLIRVSIDRGHPIDIDIAGAAPGTTFLDEIVDQINAVAPGLASPTDKDRLRLTSPTRGESSHLALLPVRVLELIEYPAIAAADPSDGALRSIRPGDRWGVTNEGAAEGDLEVEIRAPHGIVGPQLVNLTLRQRVRIMDVVRPGERLKIWRDPDAGLQAMIIAVDEASHAVPASRIIAGPLSGVASESDRTAVLTLPHGRSEWSYLDCHGARFDSDRFDQAHFAGGRCKVRAVFNVSHFGVDVTATEAAVFSPTPPFSDQSVEILFHWLLHQPGAFVVNLPADLPERFGAKFNEARFASAGEKSEEGERYEGVVTEPPGDADHLITRVNAASTLVTAAQVARVPLGYVAMVMPFPKASPAERLLFRKPRALTLGSDDQPARIYLAEKDVPGFVELSARQTGVWGNTIRVVARKAGPASFDVTISFPGARFENARQTAMGGKDIPTLIEAGLKIGAVGILQAKAAGVHSKVTRERAESIC